MLETCQCLRRPASPVAERLEIPHYRSEEVDRLLQDTGAESTAPKSLITAAANILGCGLLVAGFTRLVQAEWGTSARVRRWLPACETK
jgi:hypothetical protein